MDPHELKRSKLYVSYVFFFTRLEKYQFVFENACACNDKFVWKLPKVFFLISMDFF